MPRKDRRYDRAHYSTDHVRKVATHRVEFTRKSIREAFQILPPDRYDTREEIRRILVDLHEDEWCFCQEKDGRWVDIYNIDLDGVDVWLKIKIETDPSNGEQVVVISFHEWDHTRRT